MIKFANNTRQLRIIMAKNYFNRYVWLIDTINRHGYITLPEISRLWEDSALNDEGGPLAERTFHNHRRSIEETFGIEIHCDRVKGYYIDSSDDSERDSLRQWLLESFSLNNLLNESTGMRDRILFEAIPSSQKWLMAIVNAIKDGKAIELTYQSYTKPEPHTFVTHPYCLKLFRRRWYILSKSEQYDHPRVYSLDRVLGVFQTDKPLEVPKGFNAKDYFHNYFGIIVGDTCHAQIVRVRVSDNQAKYFESLPLHSSQEIEQMDEHYTIFKYYIDPTFDFKQELLGRGPTVEVLEPQWFRDEIKNDIAKMMQNYE